MVECFHGTRDACREAGKVRSHGTQSTQQQYFYPAPTYLQFFGVNGVYTLWTGERFRGYMTYLGWQDNWPSSAHSTVGTPWHDNPYAGVMDWTNYPSKGTTLLVRQQIAGEIVRDSPAPFS